MPSSTRVDDPVGIAQRILVLRGQRALLDSDLAELYGVQTERLNHQVRRNPGKFHADFVFHLNINEVRGNRLQIAGGSRKHRNPWYLPLAFTEHGAIMAATVLNSPRAVEMSVYVVRALDARTRRQFEEVYAAIRALMTPPVPKWRPIGFTVDLDKDH